MQSNTYYLIAFLQTDGIHFFSTAFHLPIMYENL